LLFIDVVAAGIAAGMEVADPLKIVPDVTHHIAVHDLRVVDVIENFHARRIHPLHHIDAPCHVIEHVAAMIHLAVEQLHADGDALHLGVSLDVVQKRDAVVRTVGVRLFPYLDYRKT
jgi:hypothetical protein